ncbi:MAG: hypothetical protein Kow0058_05250 [Roseovarius sp.]
MTGAAAVAAIDSLSGPEQFLVRALRCASAPPPGGMARIMRMLEGRMGTQAARRAHDALGEMFEIIACHGRRPLRHHAPGASCIGADERVFAHFVMLAATADREDAMLVGSLIVQGSLLLPFVDAARRAGLELLRAELRRPRAMFEPSPVPFPGGGPH